MFSSLLKCVWRSTYVAHVLKPLLGLFTYVAVLGRLEFHVRMGSDNSFVCVFFSDLTKTLGECGRFYVENRMDSVSSFQQQRQQVPGTGSRRHELIALFVKTKSTVGEYYCFSTLAMKTEHWSTHE